MDPVSRAAGGCRVIAFDRPPFGLTERPLSWTGGDANSPYSAQVRHLPSASLRTVQYLAKETQALSWGGV